MPEVKELMLLSYTWYLVLLPIYAFIGSHQSSIRKMTGKFCSYHAVGILDSKLITVSLEAKGMKASPTSTPKTVA